MPMPFNFLSPITLGITRRLCHSALLQTHARDNLRPCQESLQSAVCRLALTESTVEVRQPTCLSDPRPNIHPRRPRNICAILLAPSALGPHSTETISQPQAIPHAGHNQPRRSSSFFKMGTKSLNRRPSLVDRLRQLRTATLSPSKATFLTEKRPSYVPIHTDAEQTTAHYRDEEPHKPMSNPWSRSRSYYPGKSLDLEELDAKLEQYAQRSLESADADFGLYGVNDQASTAEASDDGPERDPSSCLEPVASLQPPSQGVGSVESCLVSPTSAAQESQPSDYELFMREALEAERQRIEDNGQAPRPAREPPLNPFYSNNWDHQSRPSPKLGGIQEAGDDNAREGGDAHAVPGHVDSERRALSSETSSEGGDANLAPPKGTLSRANTDLPGMGRRVTFSNTSVPRERVERRASAPSCATRVRSPSRPVRKQKSIKQLIADYIRPPRS
ncbi:hypothetical protein KVR01_003467 [Diaporthe batatas]|uniref:uncharacterized protein n=1 Tax=Diaporthe batatas TaxID=748121 RepID=UPI001D038841|nr:uncharacterized protein KVR01_003467 [Diaporthe batatas]KAG8167778.1 hypothetical protein KVR01_003467 [Diaporthe batatas]